MKAKMPSIGAYVIAYNAIKSNYPLKECIYNALSFCDKVYILECQSDDDTIEVINREFGNNPKVSIHIAKEPWDFDDACIVGKRKQEARQLVKEDYCFYYDLDEIVVLRNKDFIYDMILNNFKVEVFSIPYITFFGDANSIGNFKEAENFWRWKLFKNNPLIGHGPHGAARKYDTDGKMYIDKKISDGCELINLHTLEVVGSLLYMPQEYVQAGNLYKTSPKTEIEKTKISNIFSEIANQFGICVYHYGWVDFENKANNAISFWIKSKSYRSGEVEHSRLFDDIDVEKDKKIRQWQMIDTIQLKIKEHPSIMRDRLLKLIKPKILNISLASHGAGVPKWGHQLKDALKSKYDFQWYAFEDYAKASQDIFEFQKAEHFIKWIKSAEYDKNAIIIFGDGFWAASYPGPAKVVSIIHGLWYHPLRNKWKDGLEKQREILFKYQIEYYKKAKSLGHSLVCVSPFIHTILKEEYNIDSILIPNAIDLDFYDRVHCKVEKDRPLILHGITSVNKGQDILNEFENHPLIKDKFDIGSIDEIANYLQIDKASTFKIADIAFLPSKWEANSFLLLECMANNLPFVAHRAGILHCNLPGQNECGIVLDEYDVNKFAESVVELSKNTDKYKNGRKFILDNHFTKEEWENRMRQLIYEVL